jgi:D-cysteine desulfhydrase
LVLSGNPPGDVVGNLLLDKLLDAEVVWTEGVDPDEILEKEFKSEEEKGSKPYLIPYGGSNEYGVLAYIEAMTELLTQDPGFDRIVFATSSGGTQAGMILGARLMGFGGKILGISVDEPATVLRARIADLVNNTSRWLNEEIEITEQDVLVEDGFIGEGYAILGDLEREAIRTFASREGILLDPVYTGRAAGGMMAHIRTGQIPKDERVLFWHTGGTPAIFVYGEELL